MRHVFEPDHLGISRFSEGPNRPTVGPSRLIPTPFAPLETRLRWLSFVSDTPPVNLARAPRMRRATESDGRRDLARFPEDPDRPAVDPCRRILGSLRPARRQARRLLRITGEPPLIISPFSRGRFRGPNRAIPMVSRDFTGALTDRPAPRGLILRPFAALSLLDSAGFRTFRTLRRCVYGDLVAVRPALWFPRV